MKLNNAIKIQQMFNNDINMKGYSLHNDHAFLDLMKYI